MPKVIKGVIKGKTIVLKKPIDLPEGTEVTMNFTPKIRLLRHAGVWKNCNDLDGIIKEIYESRTFSKKEMRF